jgi:ferredoxin-fold anticodon binding domain-containing protein
MMEKKMVFPVGQQIDEAKKTIQKALSNYKVTEGVVIKGTLSDITPDKVYLTPKHLYSVVFAHGKVNLKVGGLKGI